MPGEFIESEPIAHHESMRNHTIDTAIDLTAGTIGGIANCLSAQPLDTVKVKMQTFPGEYKNALNCLTQTFKKDGFTRGLYAGTVPALVANVAENAVLFMFYGICQKAVMKVAGIEKEHDLSSVQKATAGSGAAFFAALALTPTELVKCRLQAMREMVDAGKLEKSKSFSGPFAISKHIAKTEGLRGFFRGFVPTVAREMPGYFFFFGAYETSRRLMTPPGKTPDEIGPVKTVISGGFGGIAFWTSVFPADVVKSRAQISSGAALGFVQTLKLIVKEDGVKALYKGLGPSLVRSFIATGCLFVSYEYTKKFLESLAYGNS
ncbi:mitochondrial ornithine transporter 1-like [Tubulanus polymorphus]|uniref:mitochondrial ornithine transporter 1-like n=1 Tax=Tubulanus polymorphus TaxID=672921 RepID=UPI003DA46D2E